MEKDIYCVLLNHKGINIIRIPKQQTNVYQMQE